MIIKYCGMWRSAYGQGGRFAARFRSTAVSVTEGREIEGQITVAAMLPQGVSGIEPRHLYAHSRIQHLCRAIRTGLNVSSARRWVTSTSRRTTCDRIKTCLRGN
jgi:hypothetical protein